MERKIIVRRNSRMVLRYLNPYLKVTRLTTDKTLYCPPLSTLTLLNGDKETLKNKVEPYKISVLRSRTETVEWNILI